MNSGALLAKAFARGNHESVGRLRRDEHAPTQDCWLHGSDFCLESDPSSETGATRVARGGCGKVRRAT
jgi:hypothetical protein